MASDDDFAPADVRSSALLGSFSDKTSNARVSSAIIKDTAVFTLENVTFTVARQTYIY